MLTWSKQQPCQPDLRQKSGELLPPLGEQTNLRKVPAPSLSFQIQPVQGSFAPRLAFLSHAFPNRSEIVTKIKTPFGAVGRLVGGDGDQAVKSAHVVFADDFPHPRRMPTAMSRWAS